MLKIINYIIKYHLKNSTSKYKKITSDSSIFTSINYLELSEIISKQKNKIIFIGRTTCPNCRIFLPILYRIARDNSFQIYYFNTDENKEDQAKDLLSSLSIKSIPLLIQSTGDGLYKQMKVYNNEHAVKAWLSTAYSK